jgi:hypothetical protein
LDVSFPDYRDSGRFILVAGTVRRVRFVRRSNEEIAALVRATAWIAHSPVIAIKSEHQDQLEPDDTSEPDDDPMAPARASMRWSHAQLLEAATAVARERGLPDPSPKASKDVLLRAIRDPLSETV